MAERAEGLAINVDAILSRAQASVDAFCREVESRKVSLNIDASVKQKGTFGGQAAPAGVEPQFEQPAQQPPRVDPQQLMQQRWIASGVYGMPSTALGGAYFGLGQFAPSATAAVNTVYGRVHESTLREPSHVQPMATTGADLLKQLLDDRDRSSIKKSLNDPLYQSLARSVVANQQMMVGARPGQEAEIAQNHANLLAAMTARQAMLEGRANQPVVPAGGTPGVGGAVTPNQLSDPGGFRPWLRNTPLMHHARFLGPVGLGYAALTAGIGTAMAGQAYDVASIVAGSDQAAQLEANLAYRRDRAGTIPIVGSRLYDAFQVASGDERYAKIAALNIRSDQEMMAIRSGVRQDAIFRKMEFQAYQRAGLPEPLQKILEAEERIKTGASGILAGKIFDDPLGKARDEVSRAVEQEAQAFRAVDPEIERGVRQYGAEKFIELARKKYKRGEESGPYNRSFDEFEDAVSRRASAQASYSDINSRRETAIAMAGATDELTKFRGEYGIELYNRQLGYGAISQRLENQRDVFGGLRESQRQEIEQRITPLERELERAKTENRTADADRYRTQISMERAAIGLRYATLEFGTREQYVSQNWDMFRMSGAAYQQSSGESYRGRVAQIEAERRRALKEAFGTRYRTDTDTFKEEITDEAERSRRKQIENVANVDRFIATRQQIGSLTQANYQIGQNYMLASNQQFGAQFAGVYGQFAGQLASLTPGTTDYNVVQAQRNAALAATTRGQTNQLANIGLEQNIRENVFAAQRAVVSGNVSTFAPMIESILGGTASRFQQFEQMGLIPQAQRELELGRMQLEGAAAEYGASFRPMTYGRLGEIGGSFEINRNFAAFAEGQQRITDFGVTGTSITGDQIGSIGAQVTEFQKQGEGAPATQGDQQITAAITTLQSTVNEISTKLNGLPGANGNN